MWCFWFRMLGEIVRRVNNYYVKIRRNMYGNYIFGNLIFDMNFCIEMVCYNID